MDEMAPEFREWLIPFGGGGYLVLYHYDGALVAIPPHARSGILK
jgi:hypothetical protein